MNHSTYEAQRPASSKRSSKRFENVRPFVYRVSPVAIARSPSMSETS
jgi:hypothetical protein